MLENGMLTGAANHYDRRAANAEGQAQLAETLAECFMVTLKRCTDVPMTLGNGRSSLLSDELTVAADPADAKLLLNACSLVVTGKFEASSAALLAFVEAVAKRYGINAAEAFLE